MRIVFHCRVFLFDCAGMYVVANAHFLYLLRTCMQLAPLNVLRVMLHKKCTPFNGPKPQSEKTGMKIGKVKHRYRLTP